MTDPDDPLAGIDLDAWQPPPPPGGIADAVVNRMREPVAVPAHELDERGRRHWPRWAGAAVALVAIAGGVATLAPRLAPAPRDAVRDRGDIVVDRASHIELGATAAELEAGAALHWQRDGRRIAVVQARGGATWRIGGDDTLVLDAGAMGASVEASGASLRVEVDMQITSSDARLVAASAVTAAAVALVTVIVYQGHVRITSAGQVVNLAAGSSAEIRPGGPPRELHDVAVSVRHGAPAPGDPAGATPPAAAVRNVPPSELEAHRIKGDRNIFPDEDDKRAIESSDIDRVITSVKMCVDTAGQVSETRLLRSSNYPGYDRKILADIETWGFEPIQVDGKAVPVCAAVTFIYKPR
jgi:TonB family protein